MEKRKIGIDIDEVITEFVKSYLKIYNHKYDDNKTFEDICSYDLWKPLGITRGEAFEISDEFYASRDFDNISFVDGAKDGIERLSRENELFFITSRPVKIKEKTEQFFKKSFPNLNLPLIFSDGLFHNQEETKANICKELNIDSIIEDNINYAFDCAETGIITYLLDKPWNQSNALPKNIIRVKNWKEIMEKL